MVGYYLHGGERRFPEWRQIAFAEMGGRGGFESVVGTGGGGGRRVDGGKLGWG